LDLFEIRNWFAHNLVDYLREKEEKSLKKIVILSDIVEGKLLELDEELKRTFSLR